MRNLRDNSVQSDNALASVMLETFKMQSLTVSRKDKET